MYKYNVDQNFSVNQRFNIAEITTCIVYYCVEE